MHDRISVNSVCFRDRPGDLLSLWSEVAPRRVSITNAAVLGTDSAEAIARLKATGYAFETIAHAFLTGPPVSDRSAWPAARATLDRLLDAADQLGAQSVYMLTGGHGDLLWEDAAQCFAEAIAPCLKRARNAGIALLTETAPTAYADLHLAHSLADTVKLAEIADIGVCIDIVACWHEAGLKDKIASAVPRLKLVQVGDYIPGDRTVPSRAAAGDGIIPVERILGWILDTGYQGAFDLELLGPRIEAGPVEAVRKTGAVIERVLAGRKGA